MRVRARVWVRQLALFVLVCAPFFFLSFFPFSPSRFPVWEKQPSQDGKRKHERFANCRRPNCTLGGGKHVFPRRSFSNVLHEKARSHEESKQNSKVTSESRVLQNTNVFNEEQTADNKRANEPQRRKEQEQKRPLSQQIHTQAKAHLVQASKRV